jgi:hypothetical protein
MKLTEQERALVIQSLEYTKRAFQETGIAPWGSYPTYEFKQERIKEVTDLIDKIKHGDS